jgi:FdhD protein
MASMSKQKPDIFITQVTEWTDGTPRRFDDYVAAEEPLEIRVNDAPFGVTLRTPGNDCELAIGLLFSEGVITTRDQVLSAGHSDDPELNESNRQNVLLVRVSSDAQIHNSEGGRKFTAGSACGVCGKAAIDELRNRGIRRPETSSRFHPQLLCALPEKLRSAQANFSRTGGLHAAGLFTASGELLVLREDIGRHNAVDKVTGWALDRGSIPLSGHILLVSGRGGFEIVQKSIVAGLPLLASVSAPSSLAVRLAREFGITLIGFLRGQRFVAYSGEERLVSGATAETGGR